MAAGIAGDKESTRVGGPVDRANCIPLFHNDFAAWCAGYGQQLNSTLPRVAFHCCKQFAVGGQTPIPHRTRLKVCEWLSAPRFRIKAQQKELVRFRLREQADYSRSAGTLIICEI